MKNIYQKNVFTKQNIIVTNISLQIKKRKRKKESHTKQSSLQINNSMKTVRTWERNDQIIRQNTRSQISGEKQKTNKHRNEDKNCKKHNGEHTPWKTITDTEEEIRGVISMDATQEIGADLDRRL